jgi:hypothetical protein
VALLTPPTASGSSFPFLAGTPEKGDLAPERRASIFRLIAEKWRSRLGLQRGQQATLPVSGDLNSDYACAKAIEQNRL